jgi:hypothetical protein
MTAIERPVMTLKDRIAIITGATSGIGSMASSTWPSNLPNACSPAPAA